MKMVLLRHQKIQYCFISLMLVPFGTILAKDPAFQRNQIKQIAMYEGNDVGFVSVQEKATVQRSISGRVTDLENLPLAGVNVGIKGSRTSTSTNEDGAYILTVPNEGVLVFTFIGYSPQEADIGHEIVIDISLEPDNTNLDEVVVVGYGTQKRTTLTGAVSIVKGDELVKAPVANISNSMTGKLAGVSMRPNGGQPGKDNPDIHIRGIATTGQNAPLIVVDGIIRDNISQIDPAIIESVSVLKDAAAVAPYGLGGANGVILITTKTGEAGSPKLAFNSYYGTQTPTYYPNLLDAKDFMRLSNEAYLNEFPQSTDFPFLPEVIANYDALHLENPDLYPNSNTKELVKLSVPLQNYNLQLRGGTKEIKYYAGLGYYKQDGVFERVGYERFNYNMNLESQISNNTTVSFSLISSIEQIMDLDPAVSSTRLFRSGYKFIPTEPLYYTNGLWGQWAGNSPVGLLNSGGYAEDDGKTTLSTISIEQKLPFVEGLSVKATVSYDTHASAQKGWHKPVYYWEQNTTTNPYTYTKSISNMETSSPPYAYLRESQSKSQTLTYQGFVNYGRSFGVHEITGLLVAEARNNKWNQFWAQRNNFAVDIDEMDMGSSAKADFDNGGSSTVGAQIGYVYRVGYIYDSKYMFEASGRYDGHYYFAPNRRWGYFPAFSMGWRLSEEDFLKDVPYLNELKIRGSWGRSGNLTGTAYQYLSGYTLTGNDYAFGTGTMVQGSYAPREANPSITWEVSNKTNIGFETILWNSLLTVEADYFFERRTGMLLPPAITVPQEYGLSLAQENAGEMENRGIELTVGSRYTFQNGLRLALNGNFSVAKNKMINVFETDATRNNPNRSRTGRPFGTPFGYQSLGLFGTDDDKNGDGLINEEDGYTITQFGTLHPGDIKYKDISGPEGVPDGVIDGNDEISIGYPVYPLMSFGFTPTAEWKGFDLSLFFQGSSMVSFNINRNFQTVAFLNDKSSTDYEYFDNRWTPEHQNAKYPRAMSSPDANNSQASDFWMLNTSYLRLKTATFGYTVPINVIRKMKIENLRVYFSGQNLLTFSNLKFNDPEMGYTDREAAYPNMKSYSFGLSATF